MEALTVLHMLERTWLDEIERSLARLEEVMERVEWKVGTRETDDKEEEEQVGGSLEVVAEEVAKVGGLVARAGGEESGDESEEVTDDE